MTPRGVPPGLCCRADDTGQPCLKTAPYRAYFAGCPSCRVFRGRDTCRGHSVCDEHAITVRAGNHRSFLDGTRLAVARIHSYDPVSVPGTTS